MSKERQEAKIIGTRWVDTNKGDSVNPECRSRLVGREFNLGQDDTLDAATPPLEALRVILSNAASWHKDGKKMTRSVSISDFRRAYLYAKATRVLYVRIPQEDPDYRPGVLGRLRLCLYAIRHAAKGWQETLSAQLESIGYVRGVGHPSVFVHPERNVVTLVHGDDYVSSGMKADLGWLQGELEKAYEIKTQNLGLGNKQDREGKVLNRILRCTSEGWQLKADPRHAELAMEQLGISESRSVVTPGVDGACEVDDDDDVDLSGQDITRFRGVAARCNYLGFDRPDLLLSTKEVCREMSRPTTGSLRRLKRVGQYLRGKPRLIWNFSMQNHTDIIDIFSDSDWAGCRKSRKSTSGGCIMRGSHCLKSWAKTQAIVAKSSAEAELYGVVRGATEALRMTSLLQDMGIQVKMQMHLDAAAAKGIVERKGLSKVRHLDVNVLWLQETCARRDIPLHKIPGEDNPADLTTKHIGAAKIDQHGV